jgi:hypothetical protein
MQWRTERSCGPSLRIWQARRAGLTRGPAERNRGEAKHRRVEHGQGAATVSGSPEGGARDEGKEGSSAGKNGGGGNACGERGYADEQESEGGMSDSDDEMPLGARKAEVKAEKQQKDDESDDDTPLLSELRLRCGRWRGTWRK